MISKVEGTLLTLIIQWKDRADKCFSDARANTSTSEKAFQENIALGRLCDRAHGEFTLCLEYYKEGQKIANQ